MITFLHKYGTAEEKFHLVDFDLGAHAAGKAADTVDFAFARVTGSSLHSRTKLLIDYQFDF